MCSPRSPLVRERLSEPDATCDGCLVRLERGEEVLSNLETGEIFCSARCANEARRTERELRRRRRTPRTLAMIGG